MTSEPMLTSEQALSLPQTHTKPLQTSPPAKRVKHFVDQMQIPAKHSLAIPEPLPRVDTEFFEAIMKDAEAGRVLTVKDVAARLNVSVDKARDEIKAQLGHFKVGSDFRLPECAFRKLMARRVGYLN